jgi:hypothetical protein
MLLHVSPESNRLAHELLGEWQREERRQVTQRVAAAAHEAHAELERRRAAEYARADRAAVEASPRWAMEPGTLRLRRHACDLSLVDPPVAIHWLEPGLASTALVGPDNAITNCQRRHVFAPPVIGEHDYATVLHELGHVRTMVLPPTAQIEREVHAWKWAMRNAAVWTDVARRNMELALRSYIRIAGRRDLVGICEAEDLISDESFERERARRHQLEIQDFRRVHGVHECQASRCLSGRSALSTAKRSGLFLCARCADDAELSDQLESIRRRQHA